MPTDDVSETVAPFGMRPASLDVSVVVPFYNARDTLAEQLDALARQDFAGSWEVILADNGSTDGGGALAQQWQSSLPNLRVVAATERQRANYARNVGARASGGRLVVFCDADDVVEPGWLSAMVRGGARFDLTGAVFDTCHVNSPEVRRSYGAGLDHQLQSPKETDKLGRLDGGTRMPHVLQFLPYLETCSLGIRREALEALGGFDESFIGGGDDVEFCWRAGIAGYRLGVAPDAVVGYRLRISRLGMFKQHYWWGKAAPRLYLNFRSAGVPAKPLWLGVKTWLWIGLHFPDLFRDRVRQGLWIRVCARAWGRLVGSIQLRVLFL